MPKHKNHYDVAVIGGGPAGMMAAITAAQQGASVILLEKNDRLGKKLLITGKGRCNIANAEYDIPRFIDSFGKNGKFLFSALNIFGVSDVIGFFEQNGLKTKIERGNRVFPESDKASDVLSILLNFLKKTKVKILLNSHIVKILKKKSLLEKIILADQEISADKFILCTGGLSYPNTGSSGEGLDWAREFGHTIITPKPSLFPLKIKEPWIKDLEGLSLKNVSISIYQQNKKQGAYFGEAIFTDVGLSGPIILDMSKMVGELLGIGPVLLSIDFKPALEYNTLDKRVMRDFDEMNNVMFKNSLSKLLPKKLIPVIIRLSSIDPEKRVHSVTREERKKLLHLLKELKVQVAGVSGFKKAIVTAGGVSLKEIDPKTMCSKIVPNLYFAGEIIDLDGPTGGYNLQVCWSTGYLAGLSAGSKK